MATFAFTLLAANAVVAPGASDELTYLRSRVAELEARLLATAVPRPQRRLIGHFSEANLQGIKAHAGANGLGTGEHSEDVEVGEHGTTNMARRQGSTASTQRPEASTEPTASTESRLAASAENTAEAASMERKASTAHGEHGEHGEGPTIFKMPNNFNTNELIMYVLLLILVTIAFEKGSEMLEEKAHHEGGIREVALQKIFKELTILGFVAFSATVLLQSEVLPLTEDSHLNFEFAHILMFTTAIVYAKEIMGVSNRLHVIAETFEAYDAAPTMEVLRNQVESFGNRTDDVPVLFGPLYDRRIANLTWNMWWSRRLETLLGLFSAHEDIVTFKVLKLDFLGYQQLLGTRFSFSGYIVKCTQTHVGEMIDLEAIIWSGLCAVLLAAICFRLLNEYLFDPRLGWHGDLSPETGTLLFVLWGFLLLGSEVVLLAFGKRNLSRMIEDYHHIRTGDTEDRWEEYEEHQAILEAELRILDLVLKDPKEATAVQTEMRVAGDKYWAELQTVQARNGESLKKIEHFFQLIMLLQSMLQSVLMLMIARNCFVLFGWVFGAIALFFMWLPTELMSSFVTPAVLAQISLAYAVGVTNKAVLADMIEEATNEGDYAAAGQVLEIAMTDTLADADLEDVETTRHKVKDLVKLGELKWRYRVVEEGQNPRDEAIKVLDQAVHYVVTNIGKVLDQHGRQYTKLSIERAKEEQWADELGDCYQGLALARLIFNGSNRDEDETISKMLSDALKMRTISKNKAKVAETHNSLGALAQKQRKYAESEAAYVKSLEVRQSLKPSTDREQQEKDQALAQSYTSLGNLFSEMGELARALEQLQLAKECYVKGFNASHPKVAWAVEAMATVHTKMHSYRVAQECIDEAIAIRRALQDKGDGKALFSKELRKDDEARNTIMSERRTIREHLKRGVMLALVQGRKGGGTGVLITAQALAASERERAAAKVGAAAEGNGGGNGTGGATAAPPTPPAPKVAQPSQSYLEKKRSEAQ